MPISATPQTIGELIVARRKESGFTQKQLAITTQIPRKQLGHWERGRSLPSQEDLNRLAQFLKLPAATKTTI